MLSVPSVLKGDGVDGGGSPGTLLTQWNSLERFHCHTESPDGRDETSCPTGAVRCAGEWVPSLPLPGGDPELRAGAWSPLEIVTLDRSLRRRPRGSDPALSLTAASQAPDTRSAIRAVGLPTSAFGRNVEIHPTLLPRERDSLRLAGRTGWRCSTAAV